ncbi:MAG: PQQ-binding-like beta-propeller repeat protein [Acidobacteriota bacterium]
MRPRLAASIFSCLALFCASTLVADSAEWSRWGGPNENFIIDSTLVPWGKGGPTEVFRVELGAGHAAPTVAGDTVYGVHLDGDQYVLSAFGTADGASRWAYRWPAEAKGEEQVTQFGIGPNAMPLVHGGHVVAIGWNGELVAVDAKTGKLSWSKSLRQDYGLPHLRFGYSAAPVPWGDRVVVSVGGRVGMVAFDVATGAEEWTSEAFAISYAAPRLLDVDGERQLVTMTPDEVLGVAVDGDHSGAVRWRHPHVNQFTNNCIGPWLGEDGTMMVASQGDAGAQVIRVQKAPGGFKVEQLSREKKVKFFHSIAIRRGDTVYGASGDAFLLAFDVPTGKVLWQKRGFPKVNMVAAGERTLMLDVDGRLLLTTLDRDGVEVLAEAELMTHPAWAPPTVVGQRVYLRDNEKLVALDLAPAPAAKKPAASRSR